MTPRPVSQNIALKFGSQREKHQHHPGACKICRISGSTSVLLSQNLHIIKLPRLSTCTFMSKKPCPKIPNNSAFVIHQGSYKYQKQILFIKYIKGLNYLKVGKCFYYTTLTIHFILIFQNRKFFTFYCPNLIPMINIIS